MNRRIYYIVGTVIILLSVYIYWGGAKDIWFCDEVYTYESANSQYEQYEHGWTALSEENKWVSGAEVAGILSADSFKLNFSFISENLYTDHFPLYFYIFRTASLAFLGTCSKWIGLSVNLVCYLVLFWLLWVGFSKITECDILRSLACLVVMLHPVILSEALTIRMYLMFTCFLAALFLLVSKENLYNRKWICLCAVTVLGMLTHYYFWVYLFAFSGIFICSLFFEKNYKAAVRYIALLLASVVSVTVVFPQWFHNITSVGSKGVRSIGKMVDFSRIGEETIHAFRSVLGSIAIVSSLYIIVAGLAILGLVIYWASGKTVRMYWMILISTLIYVIFVGHTQPSNEGRYLWPAESILLMLFIWVAAENSFCGKNNLEFGKKMVVFLSFCSF